MKILYLISLALLLISNATFSQNNLSIEISGLKNSTGLVMLQLFDEHEKVIGQEKAQIDGNNCLFSFLNLSPGKYAIRYYHDENMNGKMEINLVGKPTEGYGFSNNVTGKFGPPPFEKWLFELKADTNITLKPTY
jgi:uncharacterized protein (DUF2141 family)